MEQKFKLSEEAKKALVYRRKDVGIDSELPPLQIYELPGGVSVESFIPIDRKGGKKSSKSCTECMERLSVLHNSPVLHAGNGGEARFRIHKKYYNCDGYDPVNAIVYEFQGKLYHASAFNMDLYNFIDQSKFFNLVAAGFLMRPVTEAEWNEFKKEDENRSAPAPESSPGKDEIDGTLAIKMAGQLVMRDMDDDEIAEYGRGEIKYGNITNMPFVLKKGANVLTRQDYEKALETVKSLIKCLNKRGKPDCEKFKETATQNEILMALVFGKKPSIDKKPWKLKKCVKYVSDMAMKMMGVEIKIDGEKVIVKQVILKTAN